MLMIPDSPWYGSSVLLPGASASPPCIMLVPAGWRSLAPAGGWLVGDSWSDHA